LVRNIYIEWIFITNIHNEFAIYPLQKSIQIGTTTVDPAIYGFDYYGIKQDEKILNTDVRKLVLLLKSIYN
jgi:hypothetical protein